MSSLSQFDAVVPHVAFVQNIGPVGLVVILILALLIFGKRLPDVARSMGKGIVEFKKGLRGVEDEIDNAVEKPYQASHQPPQQSPHQPPRPDTGSD